MPREHLPNSPLADVSCEVRFRGQLSLLSAWGAFQAALQSQFPKLLLPQSAPGIPTLLQPMRLAADDESEFVMLAINSFAFSTRKYVNFATFHARFTELFSAFCAHASAIEPTRLGLRFINVLPPDWLDGGRPDDAFHRALKLQVVGADVLGKPTGPIQAVFERKRDAFNLRIALYKQENQAPAGSGVQQGVHLDIDCYADTPGTVLEIPDLVTGAHQVTEDAFFSLITDDYLGYLRGEA